MNYLQQLQQAEEMLENVGNIISDSNKEIEKLLNDFLKSNGVKAMVKVESSFMGNINISIIAENEEEKQKAIKLIERIGG